MSCDTPQYDSAVFLFSSTYSLCAVRSQYGKIFTDTNPTTTHSEATLLIHSLIHQGISLTELTPEALHLQPLALKGHRWRSYAFTGEPGMVLCRHFEVDSDKFCSASIQLISCMSNFIRIVSHQPSNELEAFECPDEQRFRSSACYSCGSLSG